MVSKKVPVIFFFSGFVVLIIFLSSPKQHEGVGEKATCLNNPDTPTDPRLSPTGSNLLPARPAIYLPLLTPPPRPPQGVSLGTHPRAFLFVAASKPKSDKTKSDVVKNIFFAPVSDEAK